MTPDDTTDRPHQPGVLMGTAGYMSPEQVRAQPVDSRSDVFSFGLVIYEMVTGARAFRRESPAETMNAILHDDTPEAARLRRPVGAAVWPYRGPLSGERSCRAIPVDAGRSVPPGVGLCFARHHGDADACSRGTFKHWQVPLLALILVGAGFGFAAILYPLVKEANPSYRFTPLATERQ